jgi:aconitate hydratase
LKKQGMLGVTFSKEEDYDLIQEDDRFDFTDFTEFAPDKQLTLVLNHKDGSKDVIKLNHTYNAGQIEWFKAGSALNLMAKEITASSTFSQPMSRKIVTMKSGKKVVKPVLSKPLKGSKPAKKSSKPAAKKAVKPAKKSAKATKKSVKPAKKNGIVKKIKKAVKKMAKAVKKAVTKKKSKSKAKR